MDLPAGSDILRTGMIALCFAIAVAVIWAARSWKVGLVVIAWLSVVSIAATSGALAHFTPPRPLFVFVPTLLGVAVLYRRRKSSFVALPLGLLVGFQAFRIPVELLIHQAVVEGIAPPQLTWWPGLNQDVVTGVTAALLAPFASRLPAWAVYAWNIMGLGLLAWVVLVAVVSMPTPLQLLEPDNVWVAFFPYVGLPIVLVSAALLGHLVVFEKLRRTR